MVHDAPESWSPPEHMTSHRLLRRRLAPVVTAAALVVGTAVVAAVPAHAAPSGDKRSQAAELENQVEQSDMQISALAEKLHAAEARRDAAQQTVQDTQAQIVAAEGQVHQILGLVQQNLASLYRRTLRGSTVADIDFSDATDLLKRAQYSQAQNDHDDSLLNRLAAAQQDLAADRDDAARARDAAQAETDQIAAAKSAFEAARAEQQSLLDKIKGSIAAEVAAEKARRDAEVRAKFSGAPESFPNVGPPNGSASQAIAYARAVVGAPYSTNPRMGPSYDCSGLVIAAWGAAGVSLSGSSGSMYASLPHVPMNAIQAGDLIFWGSGGGSHVALYIGGGQIIDASSSQDGVMLRAIWGSPIGAARVT
jgi:cell wall-associated NlpC family hydrolase